MARRKPQTIRTRRERLEREAERAKQRHLRTWLIVGGGVLVVAALVAAMFLLSGGTQPVPGAEAPTYGAEHVPEGTEIAYERIPPSSGTHWPRWANYGVYEEPLPEGLWVHNLEHGAIVVLYNCPQGCPDLVGQLREAYNSLPPSRTFGTVKLVATSYPKLQQRLAYLAWGREYLADEYKRDELVRFYQAYMDKGPERAP